jgi:GH43 family beta-xylosidase
MKDLFTTPLAPFLLTMLAAACLVGCCSVGTARGQDKPATYTNPVGDETVMMGDPFVMLHEGRYYLYGSGFGCWTSTDLVDWKFLGQAFRKTNTTWGQGSFWAPEVSHYRGKFYAVYCAVNPQVKGHRICIAVSDRPEGPFQELYAPWSDDPIYGIDGHIFVDDDGTPYLFFDKVGAVGDLHAEPSTGYMFGIIYAVQMKPDLSGPVGEPVLCTQAEQPWENPKSMFSRCNEGAFVLRRGDTYYMTYSANHYRIPEYGVGYATAKSPLGPWTKSPHNPLVASDLPRGISGPGHNSITTSPDGRELFIVYHSHKSANPPSGGRVVNIDRLRFDADGRLRIVGPTRTPQPMPSGAVRGTPLPKHLMLRHTQAIREHAQRRTQRSVYESLRSLPLIVAGSGKAIDVAIPFTNTSTEDVTLSVAWPDYAGAQPRTRDVLCRAQTDAVATFRLAAPAADAAAPLLNWKLQAGGDAFAEGTTAIPLARIGSYVQGDATPDAARIDIVHPWQVTAGTSEWKGRSDCSAVAWVNRSVDGLTVTVSVTDQAFRTESETFHENDSVEIYLDTRPAATRGDAKYARGVFQATFVPGLGTKPERFTFGRKDRDVPGTKVESVATALGYRIKIFLPFDGLKVNHFVPGEEFNFDIAINDADLGGRKVQMIWSGGDRNWGDATRFGRLRPAK